MATAAMKRGSWRNGRWWLATGLLLGVFDGTIWHIFTSVI